MKEVVNLPYNGVGFNKDYVKSFESAEAFIEAAEPHLFKGERGRAEMLTDVWNLAQETPKAIEKMKEESGGDLKLAADDQKAEDMQKDGEKLMTGFVGSLSKGKGKGKG